MTANDFRHTALSFPEAVESSHMDHPDFRVGGKIFATLGYFDKGWGMVKLMPDQQEEFVQGSAESVRAGERLLGQAWIHVRASESVRRRLRCGRRLSRHG